MRAGNPKGRSGSAWTRRDLDLAKAGALFREAGFVISQDDPIDAYGHHDRAGRWRRMHAVYPDGWRATLNIGVKGGCTLSYALRLVSELKSSDLKGARP